MRAETPPTNGDTYVEGRELNMAVAERAIVRAANLYEAGKYDEGDSHVNIAKAAAAVAQVYATVVASR